MEADRNSQSVVPEKRSAGTLYKRRERLAWTRNRNFRILSIDGGGIRGILPLTYLAGLEQAFLKGQSIANYFDLITGTSTGGIIALGLGKGLTATEILKVYTERGAEVFPPVKRGFLRDKIRFVRGLTRNSCDTSKLYALIDDVVGTEKFGQSRKRLCIPSAETRHFEPFIYKTPHHPDYRLDWKQDMAVVAKSTSAAPTYFEPVQRQDGYEFVDGGVWANNPIMVGVADALACFDIARENISVLSMGCVKDHFTMNEGRRQYGGMAFWHTLLFETMHIQTQNVTGQARLIVGGDNVVRIDAEPLQPRIELSDWKRSCEVLPSIAKQLFEESSGAVAHKFLTETAEPFIPFYNASSTS